jgi:hypothetical protein
MMAQNPIVINVLQAKEDVIRMSTFFNDVEYVKLETTKACLLKSPYIHVTEKYIIAIDGLGPAFLFDRKTGKFIHEISKKGPGPKEYKFVVIAPAFDEKRNILFVSNWNSWKAIDIVTNEVILSITPPFVHYGGEKYQGIFNPYILSDGKYLGYTNNWTGNSPFILVIFNENGEVLKEYPNYIFFKRSV